MLLNRDAILRAKNLKTEEVHVPEWADAETGDDTVLVKELTGAERDAYEASMRLQRGKEFVANMLNVRAKLVVRTVVGENGERLFTDQDAGALGELSASALDRVFEVAARLSRLSDEDVDELAKNSGAAPSGDSTSA